MKHALLGTCLAALALLPALARESSPITTLDYPACGLTVDATRTRDMSTWKPQISQYSQDHYGEPTWQLDPKVIVLHYTAGAGFPWNLVSSKDFAGETPGLGVHYVVDGTKVWQLLPLDVRSRGAFGINHRAINIELVALHAADLAKRPATLQTAARLTHCLQTGLGISDAKVYSHEQVSKMDTSLVPEVKDLKFPQPYHKIDPGNGNMQTIRTLIAKLRARS